MQPQHTQRTPHVPCKRVVLEGWNQGPALRVRQFPRGQGPVRPLTILTLQDGAALHVVSSGGILGAQPELHATPVVGCYHQVEGDDGARKVIGCRGAEWQGDS